MKKLIPFILTLVCFLVLPAISVQAEPNGEQLFIQHCSACHPKGDNIIEPEDSLHKAALEAHKVNSVEAIVGIMRNPGPGMSKFDSDYLPDADAKAIAEYILKTF